MKLPTNLKLLSDAMLNQHSKRMNAIMATSDDVEFAKNYFKLLEYVRPKLQRKQIIEDHEEDRVIEIIHTYQKPEEEL